MDLEENIAGLAGKVAAANGLELVDVETFRAGRRRMVRVFIGKREGVSVEDCASVSRELGVLLDAENLMGDDSYVLEVSSPGLDRPFKTLADYRRNIGRFVRITCSEPVEGRRSVVGKLEDASDQTVVVEDAEGKTLSIPRELVAQAKVDIRIA